MYSSLVLSKRYLLLEVHLSLRVSASPHCERRLRQTNFNNKEFEILKYTKGEEKVKHNHRHLKAVFNQHELKIIEQIFASRPYRENTLSSSMLLLQLLAQLRLLHLTAPSSTLVFLFLLLLVFLLMLRHCVLIALKQRNTGSQFFHTHTQVITILQAKVRPSCHYSFAKPSTLPLQSRFSYHSSLNISELTNLFSHE